MAGVNAVGDRLDAIFAEHLLRYSPVPLGDAVDVVAEIQRQVGHVQQMAVAGQFSLDVPDLVPADDLVHQLHREFVMAGGHRRMRRKDALPPHAFDMLRLDLFAAGPVELLIEQLDDQEGGMALVHVKAVDLVVAERAQHTDAADAEHVLLAEPVPFVAAVEVVAQLPILLVVGGQVGIQEKHRHDKAGHADDIVLPRPYLDFPFLQDDRDLFIPPAQVLGDVPHVRRFDLPAGGIQLLMKIAFAGEHRHGHHRHFHIGGRLNRISGQNAKAATVRGHVGPQADLHGEVGNRGAVGQVARVSDPS